jgi:uncharacterized repeat protein (TIGR03803 family)
MIAAALIAGAGVLAMAAPAGAARALDVLYSFCPQSGCADGDQPYGGVTLTSPGRLIGTTGFGGKYGGGTVFELKEKTAKLRSLKSFCDGKPPSCQPAEGPSTTLVEDTSGNIYGTVYFGGAYGKGAVFELESGTTGGYALHYLYSFNGTDGSGPWELTYAGQATGALYDGKSPLYSTTIAGGTNNSGILFSLTPSGRKWTLQTLHNFCSQSGCTDGGLPYAGVIVDPEGNLIGTTEYYGANNAGTIYTLFNGTGYFGVIYTFCGLANCADGSGPFAGLTEDTSSNLYGTTYFGGANGDGVVFQVTGEGKYEVLHDFCSESGCTDGSQPAAAVTLDSAGNIFGTTGRGGDGNFGVLFEISNFTYNRLYSFCSASSCTDGGYPYGTLAVDSAGRLYGTTQYGGAHSLGEVYRLKP